VGFLQINVLYKFTSAHTYSDSAAHGVQLPVDGESLSVGDTVIFAESEVPFSSCWKPVGLNHTNREAVFSDCDAPFTHRLRADSPLQQTTGLFSAVLVLYRDSKTSTDAKLICTVVI